jgi:hypothetical protein
MTLKLSKGEDTIGKHQRDLEEETKQKKLEISHAINKTKKERMN